MKKSERAWRTPTKRNQRLECNQAFRILTHCILGNCSCFLAHLSRRLICELGYSWSGVRPSVVVRRPSSSSFTMLKDLPLQNRLANQSQILCEASLGRGNKSLFSRHLGHMTKMAATPIYGKNPSKIFS